MFVDNQAVAIIVNTGRSRDEHLQDALQEVAFLAATGEFQIVTQYLPWVQNRIPDLLSRWGEGGQVRRKFRDITRGERWVRQAVSQELF